MDLKLTGKVAIVTGASKGIGAAIAKSLAAEGVSVVVNYAGSKDGADRVVAAITEKGGKAIAVQGDVSLAADVKRLFEETKIAFGALDILVNNAGVYKFGPLESFIEADFHNHFNINVLGTFLAIKEALTYFPETGGTIINISSVGSKNAGAYTSLYASSKAAVDALTDSLAKELAPRRIRVNVVAPGTTETEGVHSLGVMGTDSETSMIAATPLGRLGQPGDIAAVVVFLASDASAWMTGEWLRASGGLR